MKENETVVSIYWLCKKISFSCNFSLLCSAHLNLLETMALLDSFSRTPCITESAQLVPQEKWIQTQYSFHCIVFSWAFFLTFFWPLLILMLECFFFLNMGLLYHCRCLLRQPHIFYSPHAMTMRTTCVKPQSRASRSVYHILKERCLLTFHQCSNIVHCPLALLLAALTQTRRDTETIIARHTPALEVCVTSSMAWTAERFYSQKWPTSKNTGHCRTTVYSAVWAAPGTDAGADTQVNSLPVAI